LGFTLEDKKPANPITLLFNGLTKRFNKKWDGHLQSGACKAKKCCHNEQDFLSKKPLNLAMHLPAKREGCSGLMR